MSNKLFINLFKNTQKKEDKHPDYRISAKVGDTFIDIGAAWIKDGKKGKFLSGSIDMDKLDPTNSDDYQPPYDSEIEPF